MAARMQRCIQNPVEHLQCRLLRKKLKAFSCYFCKNSILDIRLSSGYASEVKENKITKGFHGSNITSISLFVI